MSDDHIHLPPQDPALENSPVLESREEAGDAPLGIMAAVCMWNGEEYSDGAIICSAHRSLECWRGKWLEIGMC